MFRIAGAGNLRAASFCFFVCRMEQKKLYGYSLLLIDMLYCPKELVLSNYKIRKETGKMVYRAFFLVCLAAENGRKK